MKEELGKIGLSNQEAEIYLELLKEKNQTAWFLASKTKINRSVVYSVLESLLDKGLVNYVLLNGTKTFSANSPKALQEFIKQKEEILKELMPKLNLIEEKKKDIVTVEVFQGINGGLTLLKDIINSEKEYVAFGEDKPFQNIFGTLAEQYVRQLKERRIKERLLVPEGQKVLSGKYTEVRYLPQGTKIPSYTAIYGNKVAIGIFQEPLYVILIKSSDLALSYKNIFEQLWKIAKK